MSLAAAILLAQAAASNAGWFYVGDIGSEPNRAVIFADSATVFEAPNGVTQVWTWTVYEKIFELDRRESMKTLFENRCDTRQQRTVMAIGYDKSGEVVGSTARATPWIPVVPQSNGDAFFRLACRGEVNTRLPILKQSPVTFARGLFAY
jgi:hypothetical protein